MTRLLSAQTLPSAMVIIALGLVAISGWRYHHTAQAAETAQQDLHASRVAAQQISQLTKQENQAVDQVRAEQELSQQIESWAAEATIAARQVVRIDPLAPRRLGDSEYLEVGAEVDFRELTLAQLANFSAAIAAGDADLVIGGLRLSQPRSATPAAADPAAPEQWHAELTLTYLLFSPKGSAQ